MNIDNVAVVFILLLKYNGLLHDNWSVKLQSKPGFCYAASSALHNAYEWMDQYFFKIAHGIKLESIDSDSFFVSF